MNARPILMHGRSIRSLQAGRKTQTRRIVKPQIAEHLDALSGVDDQPATSGDILVCWQNHRDDDGSILGPEWCAFCAEYPEEGCIPIGRGYGQIGDLLYVRETWQIHGVYTDCAVVRYRANELNGWTEQHQRFPIDRATGAKRLWDETRWRPSIHMPRWASRITLHLTDISVARIQEISEHDAQAEGIEYRNGFYMGGIHPVKGTHKCMPTAYEAFRGLWEDTNGAGAWDRNDWVWVLEFDVIHENVNQVMERLADTERPPQ